jgi:hypothetical protein
MPLRSTLFLAGCLVACGTAPKPAEQAPRSRFTGIVRYYPFEPGHQWTFMVYAEPGAPGLLKVDKVLGFDGSTAVVQSGGNTTSYRIAPDGIVREPSGAYLLKEPLTLGSRWPGAKGATVEITKVDAKITTDAGTFEGCVETTEVASGDEAGLLRTTFCPDVGPVLVELRETNAAPGALPQTVTGRLRAFGPPLVIAPPEGK